MATCRSGSGWFGMRVPSCQTSVVVPSAFTVALLGTRPPSAAVAAASYSAPLGRVSVIVTLFTGAAGSEIADSVGWTCQITGEPALAEPVWPSAATPVASTPLTWPATVHLRMDISARTSDQRSPVTSGDSPG